MTPTLAKALRSASFPSIPGVTGFTRANNARFLAGLRNMKAGAADVNIACMGDSNTAGKAAKTASSYADARRYAYPDRLAQGLTAKGINASQADWWSHGAVSGEDYPAYYNNGWTATGSWAFDGATPAIGGLLFANTAADTTGAFSITSPATYQVDTIECVLGLGTGSYQYSLDGGAFSGSVALTGTVGNTRQDSISYGSVSASRSFSIRKSDANNVRFIACWWRNSTKRAVVVWNWGVGGWQAGDWLALTASRNWEVGLQIGLQSSHLTIFNCFLNDIFARPTTTTTTETNMASVIVKRQSAGSDVWLVIPCWVVTSATQAQHDAYARMVYRLGARYGCTVIDLRDGFGTPAGWQASPGFNDELHPNGIGYQDYVDRFYVPMIRALHRAA